MKQVLIVVLGISPAILTETVWALAVNEKIVPDEIEIWTTETGKAIFENAVLRADPKTGKNVWNSLKADLTKRKIDITDKLILGDDSWKIFANTKKQRLEDLLTTEDNLAAADKMLAELRKYDDPSTQILLSIAGGRKTMGALALQCMSLLGREEDKVYHVLVNSPFDTGLNPPFFFPEKKGKKWEIREKRDKTTVTDDMVQINLFSVPYIRVRPLYEAKLKEKPVSFSMLCERIQEKINRKPVLKISKKKDKVWLDGKEINLTAPEFYTLLCVIQGVSYKTAELYAAVRKIKLEYRNVNFKTKLSKFREDFGADEGKFWNKTPGDDLTKIKSECRKKGIPEALLPKGNKRVPDLSCVELKIEE